MGWLYTHQFFSPFGTIGSLQNVPVVFLEPHVGAIPNFLVALLEGQRSRFVGATVAGTIGHVVTVEDFFDSSNLVGDLAFVKRHTVSRDTL